MDNNERIDSLLVAVKAAVEGAQPSMWTALPGIVQSFNAAAGTCEVQPAIQAQVQDKTGKRTWTNLPLLVDVPVQFIGGADFFMTIPVKKGDEGLVVFACRCIDAWWQQGGVQKQAEMRMHDLSDGFLIPGFRSQANKITELNEQYPELRNKTGTTRIGLNETGAFVKGDLQVSGEVYRGYGNPATQVSLGGHKHMTGPTNPPTPPF